MKISGTGSVLPKKVVTNEMLSQFLETSDECNRKGLFKKGDLIAMSAFGAGFVSGALLLEW